MSDKELNRRVGEIIDLKIAGKYEKARRLDRELEEELRADGIKEERRLRICLIAAIPVLLTLLIIFSDYVIFFFVFIMGFIPFLAQAFQNGANIN